MSSSIEKNPGLDWEVDYQWDNGTKTETMLVFGFASADAAHEEADLSLSSSGLGYQILEVRLLGASDQVSDIDLRPPT